MDETEQKRKTKLFVQKKTHEILDTERYYSRDELVCIFLSGDKGHKNDLRSGMAAGDINENPEDCKVIGFRYLDENSQWRTGVFRRCLCEGYPLFELEIGELYVSPMEKLRTQYTGKFLQGDRTKCNSGNCFYQIIIKYFGVFSVWKNTF